MEAALSLGDDVMNVFGCNLSHSQTFCRGFTITLNCFKKTFVRRSGTPSNF